MVHMVVDQKNKLTCLRLREYNRPLPQLLSAQAIGAVSLGFSFRAGQISMTKLNFESIVELTRMSKFEVSYLPFFGLQQGPVFSCVEYRSHRDGLDFWFWL